MNVNERERERDSYIVNSLVPSIQHCIDMNQKHTCLHHCIPVFPNKLAKHTTSLSIHANKHIDQLIDHRSHDSNILRAGIQHMCL